ncbi:MAG: aldo/keto reductase [Candidatus Heimdallarchaeota archaeon]|nr:aldo/keto reductase [Candidatus Heimdallarchaeota archaeon]
MKYTKLGKTGIRVSKICFGTMGFGWMEKESDPKEILEKAYDLGINFFDTANVYGGGKAEEILGVVMKERREEIIIASKVFWSFKRPADVGLSRPFLQKEINESLKRLQTNYLDLFLVHRFDPHVSLENMLRTLNNLIHDGKILHIGASSMYAWEFTKSLWIADKLGLEGFQVSQPHYNLLYREEEREILPLCKDQQIGVMPWGPLARGVLTGKYSTTKKPDTKRAKVDSDLEQWFLHPQDFAIVDRVIEVAKEKDVSPAQIALAWILSKDVITSPIVGITTMKHLEEAVEAVELNLSEKDITYLEELYQPRFLTGHYSGKALAGDE